MAATDAMVYIVDDDASVREALAWLLRSRRLVSESFDSAEAFEQALGQAEPAAPACLLLDVRMPGASGLALFDRLVERGVAHAWPVIFLTGHGDVPLAVAALKHGAFDFVEKPCNDNQLVDRVVEALKHDEMLRLAAASAESINNRLSQLSMRERQVMERVLAGKLNKVIADDLKVCMRTVEVHRASLFEKMGVKTAVELARIIAETPGKPAN